MSKFKYSVRKYIVSTLLVTSIAFSPIMTGSVFAYGGPDVDANSTEVDSSAGIISQGDSGPAVTDLQTKLSNHGYDVNADGIFGQNTQDKLEDFQNGQGWNADGVVDNPTMNALNSTSADKSNNDVDENNSPNEDKSDNSDASNDNSSSNDNETEDVKENNDGSKVGSHNIGGDPVSVAHSLVGTPYVWGGTDPSVGLDSSGFINAVFADKDLSRTHAGMWANDGVEVSDPSPGDVVFFEGTYKGGVSHSGVYLGGDQMIHSGGGSEGVSVTTPESWEYYWADKYVGAKRF